MKVIRATKGDLDSCVAISHIREFSFAYKASNFKVKKYLNEFLKKGILLVAKDNGKVIGFIAAEFTLGKFVWIDAIVVDKKYRRKGVGKNLFKSVVLAAKRKGYKNMFLVVPEFNKNSINFYKSLNMKKGNTCIEFYRK